MVTGPDPTRWRCPGCAVNNMSHAERCFNCGSWRADVPVSTRLHRGVLTRRNATAIAIWSAAAVVGILVVGLAARGTSGGMLAAERESPPPESFSPVMATPVGPPTAPPMVQSASAARPMGGPMSAPMVAAPAPRPQPVSPAMVQAAPARVALLPPTPSMMTARGAAPVAPSVTAAASGPDIPTAPSVIAAPGVSVPTAPSVVAAPSEAPKSAPMVNSEGWLERTTNNEEPEVVIYNDEGLEGTFTMTDGYQLRKFEIKPDGLHFSVKPGVYDYRVLSTHHRRTGRPDQMGKLTLKKYRSYEARFFKQFLDDTVVKELGDGAK